MNHICPDSHNDKPAKHVDQILNVRYGSKFSPQVHTNSKHFLNVISGELCPLEKRGL
jgi:hypothetical protein